MLGAIIGDLAGSIYEFDQYKKVSKIKVTKLLDENCFYSDDTILTIAVLDGVLNNAKYEDYLKKYTIEYINYKPSIKPYFRYPFSPGFIKWVNNEIPGTSAGNGAIMRISPIGYLFDDEKSIIEEVKKVTITSHNSKEAISAATKVALIIYYARKGYTKQGIIDKLNLNFQYKEFIQFNMTCDETIDNCLYALFSSNSFEEAIKKVISYGGDTDTNACIVGSMAEALFKIDKELVEKALDKIPVKFQKILEKGYSKINTNSE